jgi:hypothetical protein
MIYGLISGFYFAGVQTHNDEKTIGDFNHLLYIIKHCSTNVELFCYKTNYFVTIYSCVFCVKDGSGILLWKYGIKDITDSLTVLER